MSEMIFVLKCLLATALITIGLQLQTSNGVSLEKKAEYYLETSPLVAWVQSAASGGALAIHNAVEFTTGKAREIFASDETASRSHRAGR